VARVPKRPQHIIGHEGVVTVEALYSGFVAVTLSQRLSEPVGSFGRRFRLSPDDAEALARTLLAAVRAIRRREAGR
jgi:hypothetical protein